MAKKPNTTQIQKLIRDNKLDELERLLDGVDPVEVRMLLNETLGDQLDNYDLGFSKAMKDAKKLYELPWQKRASMDMYKESPTVDLNKIYETPFEKDVKLGLYTNSNPEDMGQADVKRRQTPIAELNTNGMQKSPGGIFIHEAQHFKDATDPKYKHLDMIDTAKKGLKGAEEAYSKHHKPGFFELEALKKLLTNKKLQAAIPLVGPALGAYSMLDSGDVFAADPTGMFQSDNVGEGSDQLPDEAEKDIFNARMKKTKQKLNDFNNLKKLD